MKKILSFISVLFVYSLSQIFAVTVSDESVSGVDRYAIYIGSNYGGKSRERLLYAGSDALSFKNAMSEIGGVTDSNCKVLIDPTKDNIDKALKEISTAITSKSGQTKRSEFIFYYSGHSDENSLLLGDSKYDYSKLKSAITEVPSDIHVVILDSCYSGNFIRTKGGQKRKPFLIDDSSVVTGHAYLSSSSDNESSQESDEIESSYFTNAMITGLRGAADTSGDNKVTLNELYSYAFNDTLSKTESSKAGPQHPNYNITLVGSGDLVLSDLSTADSMLSLSKDAKGKFIIRDANEKLISEINKIEGQPIFIALPVGQYSALIIDEYSTKQGTFILEKDQIYVLDQNSLNSIKRKSNRLRGDTEIKDDEEILDDNLDVVLPEPEEEDEDTLDIADLEPKKEKISKKTNKINVEIKTDDDEVLEIPELDGSEKKEKDNEIEFDFDEFYGVDVSLVPGFSFVNPDAEKLNFSFGIFGAKAKDVYGLQYSELMNISTGNIVGGQVAGLFNITTGKNCGGQVSGLFNINNGLKGSQVGGVFNISKDAEGSQFSGVYNLARDIDGVQVAGVANIAREVKGSQISGVINIAEKVDGIQIGLFNIAKENNGITIGLFNFIGNGLNDFATALTTDGLIDFYFQNGSKHLYTVMGTIFDFEEFDDEIYKGISYLGFGTQLDFGFTSFELEFLYKMCWFDTEYYEDYRKQFKNMFADEIMESISIPCFRINWNFLQTSHAAVFVSSSFDFYESGVNDVAYELFGHRWENYTDDGSIICPSFSFGGKFRL